MSSPHYPLGCGHEGFTVEAACGSETCSECDIRYELHGFEEFGARILDDDDQMICPVCGHEREFVE